MLQNFVSYKNTALKNGIMKIANKLIKSINHNIRWTQNLNSIEGYFGSIKVRKCHELSMQRSYFSAPLSSISEESMAIRVVEFSNGVYKIRKIFA